MDDVVMFRIENRMRGIMKDLIEPTSRRATEANDAINKLVHKLEVLTVRVEDTEVVQLKTLGKLGVMEEYNRRLMEFSANQSVIESKMQKDKQDFFTQFYSLSSTLTSVQEEVSVFEKERQAIREDITGLSHSLMNAKYDLEQKVAAFKDDYHERLNGAEDRILRAEIDTDTVGRKLKKTVSDLENVSNEVEIHTRYIEDINAYIKKVENKVEFSRNEHISNFEIVRSNSIKQNSEIVKVEKTIENLKKLIKDVEEQGVKSFLRTTEPLYQIFTDIPTQKIIAAYDLQKLEKKMNEKLEKVAEDLRENAESIMKIELPAPKPTEKRKKKKKTKILSPGKARVPNVSGNLNEKGEIEKNNREAVYNYDKPKTEIFAFEDESVQGQSYIRTIPKHLANPTVSEEFAGISSINQVLAPNKKLSTIQKTDKKIPKTKKKEKSYSSSSDNDDESSSSSSSSQIIIPEQFDYSPMISKIKSELQSEFNIKLESLTLAHTTDFTTLSQSLQKIDSDIRLSLKNTTDSVDISLKSNEKKIHDIEIIAQQVMYECTSQLNNRKRENNDFNYELKMIKDKISGILKQITLLLESIESITNKFNLLVEYNIVNNSLQNQDEIDRESIALMGYKEARPGKMIKMPKTVINIDKQCFSCTGQSSVVLNAFKIACLAYVPSPVLFHNEQFSRKELLEYQRKMLEGIKSGKTDNLLERRQRAASTTMKNYRPVSVPTQQVSPRSEYIDIELPKRLRKSINL